MIKGYFHKTTGEVSANRAEPQLPVVDDGQGNLVPDPVYELIVLDRLPAADELVDPVTKKLRQRTAAEQTAHDQAEEEKAALADLASNRTLGAAVEVFVERLNGLGDTITQADFAALYVAKRKASAA